MNYSKVIVCYLLFYKLLYLLWRTRLTNWIKVESSIPDHDPHTTHIASVSPSYESSKTAIIPCTFLSHMPLFGTIPHRVWTHCLVLPSFTLFTPLPSPPVSAYSRFHPSNWTCHGPCSHSASVSIRVPSHPPPSPSALISSLAPCSCLSSLRCLQL